MTSCYQMMLRPTAPEPNPNLPMDPNFRSISNKKTIFVSGNRNFFGANIHRFRQRIDSVSKQGF